MDKESFSKEFAILLNRFTLEKDNISLDEFIITSLTENGIDDAERVNEQLSTVLNALDSKYEALKIAKKNGDSRATWLHRELGSSLKNLTKEERQEITASLSSVLNETGVKLNLKESKPQLTLENNPTNAELFQQLDDKIVEATCLAEHEVFSQIKNEEIAIEENPLIKKAIQENDTASFNAVRKIAATALLIQEKKQSPDYDAQLAPTNAMIMADRGTFETQVSYQPKNRQNDSLNR